VSVFGFVAAKKAEHSIKLMCRVLEVSRSGFHAWAAREPSPRAVADAALTGRIAEIHKDSLKTYGSPRVHAELRLEDGVRVGRKRVERLMRAAGLSGQVRRRRGKTTIRVQGVRTAPDLVERDFNATEPNRLWAADITYIRTAPSATGPHSHAFGTSPGSTQKSLLDLPVPGCDRAKRGNACDPMATGATVMGGGLSLVSPRLAAACDEASEPELHAMAEVGCRLAVARSGLNDPEVAAALAALVDGRFGAGPERESLARVVDGLDKEAFDLQDAVEEGRATENEYVDAFHRARAATSLLWALHADPRTAVDNALYEAITGRGSHGHRAAGSRCTGESVRLSGCCSSGSLSSRLPSARWMSVGSGPRLVSPVAHL
jgi:hypothetical protein